MLVFAVIFTIFVAVVLVSLLIAVFSGAPYHRSAAKYRKTMLRIAGIKRGDKVVDLGAGDGQLLLEAAKLGADATGYEINPILYAIAKWRTRKVSTRISVKLKSFWKVDLLDADVVLVFGISHIMERLAKKLKKELPNGARVISLIFSLPGLYEHDKKDKVYLYIKQ